MGTPFVYLFHTPFAAYAYDVGKNNIIRLSEDVYAHLKDSIQGETTSPAKKVAEQIRELRDMGYLSDKRPSRIRHPMTDYVDYLLDRRLEKITLQITQQCNFRCKYCVYSEVDNLKQRAHSDKVMSFELAKQAIDFFCCHSVDSASRNIGFYGGEPMLEFDLLKRIVSYAERKLEGKDLTFNITTNGSLLNEENAKYLQDHHFFVTLSFDGPQEIQDKYRVFPNGSGTYGVVRRNLIILSEKFPELYATLNINMVINPDNDYSQIDEFVRSLPRFHGLKIMANMVENTDNDVEPTREFAEEYRYQMFRSLLSELKAVDQYYSPLCYGSAHEAALGQKGFSVHEGMADVVIPSGICIPGKNRLFITTEGKLFACEKVNENDEMCIGNLSDGINVDKVKRQLNACSETERDCCNCWALHLCSFCPKVGNICGDPHGEKRKRICNVIRGNAAFKLQSIVLMNEIRQRFGGVLSGGRS